THAPLQLAMRAYEDGKELSSVRLNEFPQPIVNVIYRGDTNQPLADSRLIREDHDRAAGSCKPSDGLKSARQKFELRPAPDVVVTSSVDHTVSIHKNYPFQHCSARHQCEPSGCSESTWTRLMSEGPIGWSRSIPIVAT